MSRLVARVLGVAWLITLTCPALAGSEEVVCHYQYGGETHSVRAAPASTPYTVPTLAIGSYFLFRVVFETSPAKLAAVKIYTYVDHPDGPALLQQAEYAYPSGVRSKGKHGFTGLLSVYEPVRDSELQYWCAMSRPGSRR